MCLKCKTKLKAGQEILKSVVYRSSFRTEVEHRQSCLKINFQERFCAIKISAVRFLFNIFLMFPGEVDLTLGGSIKESTLSLMFVSNFNGFLAYSLTQTEATENSIWWYFTFLNVFTKGPAINVYLTLLRRENLMFPSQDHPCNLN